MTTKSPNRLKAEAVAKYCRVNEIPSYDILTRGSPYVFLKGKSLDWWHRVMWNWIAEDKEREPRDFINEFFSPKCFPELNRALYNEREFACLYNQIVRSYTELDLSNPLDCCPYCPLKVHHEGHFCHELWNKWFNARIDHDEVKTAEIARKIAELEWRW